MKKTQKVLYTSFIWNNLGSYVKINYWLWHIKYHENASILITISSNLPQLFGWNFAIKFIQREKNAVFFRLHPNYSPSERIIHFNNSLNFIHLFWWHHRFHNIWCFVAHRCFLSCFMIGYNEIKWIWTEKSKNKGKSIFIWPSKLLKDIFFPKIH